MLDVGGLPADELIELARLLVQTPSVNGQHGELAVAQHVAGFAERHGLHAELRGLDAERPNVLVRTPHSGETGLLLVAHTDTVAPGNGDDWTDSPFSGAVRGGRLYGRGAIDNKGGLVAALAAMLLLSASPALPRPAMLIGVPDEESGASGRLGVGWLHGQGLLAGRGAIYTYPGMDEIVTGHRGVLRLALRARGEAVHSGSLEWQNATSGNNALTGLAEIVLALEQLRFDSAAEAGLFAPYRTVLTPTTMTGGAGPSMVPAEARAQLDIRLVPGVPAAEVLAAVQRIVDAVATRREPLAVEVATEVSLPWTVVQPDSPIVTGLRQAAHEVLGSSPVLTVSGPANESYLLNGYGIPTCIFGPRGEHAHAADEYVVVDSIFEAAHVYARTAELLAGD